MVELEYQEVARFQTGAALHQWATRSVQEMVPPPDPLTTNVGSVDLTIAPTTTSPPTPIAVDAEVLPTPTSEDIDNMEYFSRKMRERRREKMAEDEPTLPLTRKSKRISQKNKITILILFFTLIQSNIL